MILTKHDLNFLCGQTKLSDTKLLSLLEEDEDLLLEVLSERQLTESCLVISFPLFTKMAILNETKDNKQFGKEEKDYVTNTVTNVYPKIYKQSHYLIDKKKIGETEGQFYLVLTGLFPERLNLLEEKRGAPAKEYYIRVARKAFEHAHKEQIADHIFDWVFVLNNIKRKHWKL